MLAPDLTGFKLQASAAGAFLERLASTQRYEQRGVSQSCLLARGFNRSASREDVSDLIRERVGASAGCGIPLHWLSEIATAKRVPDGATRA